MATLAAGVTESSKPAAMSSLPFFLVSFFPRCQNTVVSLQQVLVLM
jgi:hypothetical protein